MKSLIYPLLCSYAAALPAADNYINNCKTVNFTVSGTAQNLNISSAVPLDSLQALLNYTASVGRITVSGKQNIVGTYCQPSVFNANNAKLQVYFPSITANRDSWSAQGGTSLGFPAYQPAKYSWVQYANNLGYPTLALDRLGNGQSSHPDPILVVQAPYEMAIYHDLAQQLRAGTTGQLDKKYNFLIYVGNSYGSQLGAGIAGQYPKDWDEFLLTGFSANPQQDFAGVSLTMPMPAATVDPARFGTLPPAYVTTSSQVGRTNSFFGSKQQVSFDDEVAQLFFDRKDVVSLGQFVSIYALPYNGKGYTGRVFTLTGEQDQAFCGPGSPVIGPARCGPLLQQTGALFPQAQYNWKSVNATGHAIQLHNSAQLVFNIAHRWLAGESFMGGPPA